MDDSTQHIATLHRPIVGHRCQRNRTLVRESLMGSPGVVKGDVLRQNAPHVPLPQQDQFVETFLAHRTDPAFRKCVGVRREEWRVDDLDALCLEDGVEADRERRIVVVNQEAHRDGRVLQFPAQLPGLLSDPHGIRVLPRNFPQRAAF